MSTDDASRGPERQLVTVLDYEARAREVLPANGFATLFGADGARTWQTNTNNLAALEAVKLRPRVLAGHGTRDLAVEVLGSKIAFPVILAPSGSHQRVHADGELATAKAAARAGTIMTLSTVSNFSIEEVSEAAAGPLWFQLYVLKDRGLTASLIQRAAAAGYRAIVLTVDNISGRLSNKERLSLYNYSWDSEVSHSRTLEPGRVLRNFSDVPLERRFERGSLIDAFDPTLSWRDLAWIRSQTTLPIVVKGIQTAEDARLCIDNGVDGLVVSNHGGTSVELEGLPGTMTVLPEVVDAADGKVEVLVDGGIRRGRDVFKALALGARAVLIGRAVQWGLAVSGEDGVFGVLEILRRELDSVMGGCGVASASAAPRSAVTQPGERGAGLVADLQALSLLADSGHLEPAEFAAAKRRLLEHSH